MKLHRVGMHTGSTGLMLLLVAAVAVLYPAKAFCEAVRVADDAGRTVKLQQPARRIISLAPYITELLFAAGAGDALVGVSEFSDFPAAAGKIPRIGGGAGLDLEAIVALQPDLVIAWQSGNPAGQLERMQTLGLTVFLSEPRRLEDVSSTLRRFAELSATEAVAAESIERFEQRREQLRRRYARQQPVNVFFQIWDRPLMTLNGDHLFSDVLTLCGGRNVFHKLPALAPQIDVESVLSADPDVIIVSGGRDPSMSSGWRSWPSMKAVKNDHVYAIGRDQLVRHSPRILDGAGQLCEILQRVRQQSH